MKKTDVVLTIVTLVVFMVLIFLMVDTNDKRLLEVQLHNQELKANVERNKAEIERIEYKVIQSKILLNKQRIYTNSSKFKFVIENKDLFGGNE